MSGTPPCSSEAPSSPRVVLVTGGAQGIGLGIARRFAQHGDRVVIADIRGDAAQAAAAELVAQHGAPEAYALECNVTQRPAVEAMLAQVCARSGGVDVLVNNAGICHFKSILELTPAQWDKTLAINLTAAFHCTQVVGNWMKSAGRRGRILFITSLSENFTSGAQADYAASKAGLRMLMRGFAVALGPAGITCNAVAPGIIRTELTCKALDRPEIKQRFEGNIPVGRIGTPDDIGRACVHLAAPDADYINGITLTVDGGFTVDTH